MAKPSARVPLDSLVDLACRDGIDVRPTLVRVLTDLYVQRPNHTAEEETHYTELLLGLIDSVDPKTLAVVTQKLRQYPDAPRAILRKIESLTSTKPDRESGVDLVELFFSSAPDARRLILTNLDVGPHPAKRRPVPSDGELIRRLEIAALRRNPDEFSRVLARALDIDRLLAERVTRDNSGEPILVAAKALSMQTEVLHRILLFLNPAVGQSARRIFELSQLYSELNAAAAERMLAIWQSGSARSRPMHEPVYWNDERRSLRSSDTSDSGVRQSGQPVRVKINER